MISEIRHRLIREARQVALRAHAPYSHFRVGAAVQGRKGIHVGANVENASYGLSLCAERAALAQAVAQGDRDFEAIAIACIDAKEDQSLHELMPCGACRQWMIELAPDAEIILCGRDPIQVFSVADLMPLPFQLTGTNGVR